MNIGQIARNQQMLYSIASRSAGYSSTPAAASSSKSSAYSGLLNGWGSGTEDYGDNFFSSPAALKGSVRQIARRLYDASFSSDALAENNASSLTQGVYTDGGDQTLQAIRKQLGAKVESLQKLYQPDQTAPSETLADILANRLQTVSLSDETTKKIQELALRDARNSAGAQKDGEAEASNPSALSPEDRLSMIQEEVQKFAPSKRAAALNTINRVWRDELDRIGTYIKEKNPDWAAWGDKFDVGILDDYKAGVNVWA